MAGFILFLFCSICCFVAAKNSLNTYELGKHSVPDKERINGCIITTAFGLVGLYAAINCLLGD